jgi:hypothetical protein
MFATLSAPRVTTRVYSVAYGKGLPAPVVSVDGIAAVIRDCTFDDESL